MFVFKQTFSNVLFSSKLKNIYMLTLAVIFIYQPACCNIHQSSKSTDQMQYNTMLVRICDVLHVKKSLKLQLIYQKEMSLDLFFC